MYERFRCPWHDGTPSHSEPRRREGHRIQVGQALQLSQAETLAFRKAREQKQYDKIRQEKVRTKGWQNIDRNRGKYMPYPVIVEAKGGNCKLKGALV